MSALTAGRMGSFSLGLLIVLSAAAATARAAEPSSSAPKAGGPAAAAEARPPARVVVQTDAPRPEPLAALAAMSPGTDALVGGALRMAGLIAVVAILAIAALSAVVCVALLRLARPPQTVPLPVAESTAPARAGVSVTAPSADPASPPAGACPPDDPTPPADAPGGTETPLSLPTVSPESDCIIDRELWEKMRDHLERFPRSEQGGLAIGFRRDGQSFLLGVVFPEQVTSHATFCEFSTEDLQLVRTGLDAVAGAAGAERLEAITAWVHTHPGLTVFLSDTDKDTIGVWLGLDPSARAVVIDVKERELAKQVKAFDGDFREVPLELADVPLPVPVCGALRASIEEAFQQRGRGAPTVLLAAEIFVDRDEALRRAVEEAVEAQLAELKPRVVEAVLQAFRGTAA